MDISALIILVALVLLGILVAVLVRQNKSGTYSQRSVKQSTAMARGIAVGYAIGVGPGLAIGVALDNIGLGIALGSAIGISFGVTLGARYKKQEESRSAATRQQGIKSNESQLYFLFGLLVLLVGLLILGWLFYSKMK